VSPQLTQNYSARWTGVLIPPTTSDYLIGFTGQDGYRVWLEDNLVAKDWTAHRPASTETKPMRLEKGHPYRVKIEYFQTIRGAEARLVWGRPGQDEQEALAAARNADLVIMVLGLSARIEGEEMNVHADGFAGGDRTSIDLPAPQEQLLEHVHAIGKPTILVLMNGSALAVNWADEQLPAILEAWYPGEEGGTAVAEALAGDFSPGGRLPVTFYKSVNQLPAFEDYSMAKRTYRYFDGEVLYPFGYGLSYTSFSYSRLHVDNENVPATGAVKVSIDVTNSGSVAGDEVVQLYLTHPGVAGAPLRALKGFRRVHLEPGKHQMVFFTLRERDLSTVDESGKHRIAKGKVQLWVGGGQPVVRSGLPGPSGAATEFTITSEAALPD
jgi:beta-glucosidase